jgi:TPP-dependent pyruvate/acetoin dehydrogenase alpha subunit
MTTGVGERQSGSHRGAEPTPSEALRLYESMVLIRRVEERLRDDSAAGKLPGAVHLYIGEEAVAAGVCAHLSGDPAALSWDLRRFTRHRGRVSAWMLARTRAA